VSFAIQYHLHSDALAAEYDDGFCKTSFSQKVRNAFMVYICQITEINLCMVKSTLFRVSEISRLQHSYEKWSKRKKKVGPDKQVGIYLQKPE